MADLDMSKLTSVDARGDRINLIPAEVRGFFHRHRTRLHLFLLAFFLILPWTKINGLQTVFLNIPKREFALFGVLFRAHEIPLLFFLLAIFTLGLAFMTSLWGRIWCGWACPQTVFIEAVYRRIEIWTEGNYISRRQLREAPPSLNKFLRVGSKWFLFIVVSILIGHSFMAYFVGSTNLLSMMQQPPKDNLNYFALAFFFSGLTLFDFGWFREQFCVVMCPYGRLQSVLLDRKSLAVTYDTQRGEPRKGSKNFGQNKGDCVSCNRCVQVCPTGIDIRNGLQMECIACTACIDACDEIMEKVHKPKGLIKYSTLDGTKFIFWKTRSTIYLVAIILLSLGLAFALKNRPSLDATLLRGKGAPYSVIETKGQKFLLNQFLLHVQNQSSSSNKYFVKITPSTQAEGLDLVIPENPIFLAAGESKEWVFFVRFSPILLREGKSEIEIEISDDTNPKSPLLNRKVLLLGPIQL